MIQGDSEDDSRLSSIVDSRSDLVGNPALEVNPARIKDTPEASPDSLLQRRIGILCGSTLRVYLLSVDKS